MGSNSSANTIWTREAKGKAMYQASHSSLAPVLLSWSSLGNETREDYRRMAELYDIAIAPTKADTAAEDDLVEKVINRLIDDGNITDTLANKVFERFSLRLRSIAGF